MLTSTAMAVMLAAIIGLALLAKFCLHDWPRKQDGGRQPPAIAAAKGRTSPADLGDAMHMLLAAQCDVAVQDAHDLSGASGPAGDVSHGSHGSHDGGHGDAGSFSDAGGGHSGF